MRTILVVGGYAGFHAAWKLEKKFRRDEARVVVVDPRPYMTYQPSFPEVPAGSVEARHAAVSLRRSPRRTRVISDRVVAVDHAHRTATVRQGKLLAKNIMGDLRGRKPKEYVHHSLGTVAALGLGHGIFQHHRIVMKGLPAWLMRRGYPVFAVPRRERKSGVLAVWPAAAVSGGDIVSLASVRDPGHAFVVGDGPGETVYAT